MKHLAIILAFGLVSCIPENAKREFEQQWAEVQKMTADREFKTGIAFIELHKVRYGSYPESEKDLTFTNPMDTSIWRSLTYKKLENGYELDLQKNSVSMSGELSPLLLKYPADFWKGLGCVRSNTRE